jgi:hypothetical protein
VTFLFLLKAFLLSILGVILCDRALTPPKYLRIWETVHPKLLQKSNFPPFEHYHLSIDQFESQALIPKFRSALIAKLLPDIIITTSTQLKNLRDHQEIFVNLDGSFYQTIHHNYNPYLKLGHHEVLIFPLNDFDKLIPFFELTKDTTFFEFKKRLIPWENILTLSRNTMTNLEALFQLFLKSSSFSFLLRREQVLNLSQKVPEELLSFYSAWPSGQPALSESLIILASVEFEKKTNNPSDYLKKISQEILKRIPDSNDPVPIRSRPFEEKGHRFLSDFFFL